MIFGTIHRYGFLVLCLALTTASSTFLSGSASAAREIRSTPPFHAVSFEGSWDVDVTVGKENSVVIEGKKDLIDKVKTEVVDGELRIKLDRGLMSFFSNHDLDGLIVHVALPELTAFALHGSGTADIGGLNGGVTDFALNGSGDIKAAGKLDSVALVVNGSGSADLSKLSSAKASATVNGSGDARVNPHESLAAVVNGSGAVTYVDDGVRVTSVVHGSGMVEKK